MKSLDDLTDGQVWSIQQTYARPRITIRSWNNRWLVLFSSGPLAGDGEYALYLTEKPTSEQISHLKKMLDLFLDPAAYPSDQHKGGQE